METDMIYGILKEYKANVKRTADFLEKIAAFSFGVAMFQGQTKGFILCVLALAISEGLTYLEVRL